MAVNTAFTRALKVSSARDEPPDALKRVFGRQAFAYFPRMFKPADLFDLSQTEHAAILTAASLPGRRSQKIQAYIEATLRPGLHNHCEGVAYIGEKVFIGEGTVVEDGAMIKGPAIIGRNCHLRHNAYLRENVILGDGCVVGNSSELKNALLFNKAGAPHFNYIGDSILGCKAHLGAGVVLSNVKSLAGNVTVEMDGKPFDTGLRKFGALLGDGAEVGCNSVLNPGSIVGPGRGDLSRGQLARDIAGEHDCEEQGEPGSRGAEAAGNGMITAAWARRLEVPGLCRKPPRAAQVEGKA